MAGADVQHDEGGTPQVSADPVAVMRAAWDTYRRAGPEGVLGFFAADAEFSDPREIPDCATYNGHSGYLEQQRKVLDLFEEVEMEPLEFTAVGGRVIVVFRISGRGRDSGITIETTMVQVNTVRDGLIVRQDLFLDRLEALEAIESAG